MSLYPVQDDGNYLEWLESKNEITCVLDETIAVEILLVWMGFTVFTGFSVGVVVCALLVGVV